ncbi:puratrophin-1-like isoform X2 [Lycorma delicatula]|uniref:puratrophin-1-like isoform X2 n=1 Tax=Lycorma delicatula TaxID=130591 RepID=UPI003F50DF32
MLRRNKVTPSERSGQQQNSQDTGGGGTYVETSECSAWTSDDHFKRGGNNKSLSKSKRVKNYIHKKCKDVANTLGAYSDSASKQPESNHSSWYIDNDDIDKNVSLKQNLAIEEEINDELEEEVEEIINKFKDDVKVEVIQKDCDNREIKITTEEENPDKISDDKNNEDEQINQEQNDQQLSSLPDAIPEKLDMGGLVDKHLSRFYPNYNRTRAVLLRQARDLLICEFRGDLSKFTAEFLIPAEQLLQPFESTVQVRSGVSPLGWPTSLGPAGVVLHLGELSPACLRPRDVYLCVRARPLQLATVWSEGSLSVLPATALSTMDDGLPELLNDLVISVDRAIERIPLDELPFPCFHCHAPEICTTETKDSCIQTSPMYEMDASIPHIDSDDEHEDHVKTLNGTSTTDRRITPPKGILEIPESHLTSGVYLPGLQDTNGRAVVLYDLDEVSKSNLSPKDIARLLLYYASVPLRRERIVSGLCILVIAGGGSSLATTNSSISGGGISTSNCLEVDEQKRLQEALFLVTPGQLQVACLVVFQPPHTSSSSSSSNTAIINSLLPPKSDIKCHVVTSSIQLMQLLPEDQIPSLCGGSATHDQLEWVQFFKEAEALSSRCQWCGRRLVSLMGDVRAQEEHSNNTTMSSTRRQAHLQHRATARLLADPELQSLRRDAPITLKQLQDRAQWLPHSEDVRLWAERAERLYSEVDRAAQRLEALSEKRRERLKELARIRALEDETSQVLCWLNQKGEDCLKRHSELATTLPAIKQQELDFEKFYFISMRHLDKGGDLLEEAKDCPPDKGSGLKDLARSLKHHLRGFSERLEDTRERLEDTSRCFYLLDRAYEWALEAMKYMSRVKPEDNSSTEQSIKQLRQYLMAHPPLAPEHFTEMLSLAKKLSNDKLLEQCKVAQCRCEETMEQVRGILGVEPPSWNTSTPLPGRRRSLPNPHHTAGHSCSCWDPGDTPQTPVHPLDDIREECTCCRPSPLQRSCTWQYPTENYEDEDKFSSSADNTTEGSETGTKSGEENEESSEGSKIVPPIPVNSHLHCDLNLQLTDAKCGTQTLKTKKTLLLIMREMIQTERDYVKSLEYVIENYIPELIREDIPQALRGQRNVVFGNIEKIYEFHSQFFLQELEQCEQSPLLVGQCFLRHESKFYLYALYNKNKPKSDSLMSEYGTAFFKKKQLELGDRMDLGSYLLKPVQRMGKYALLLQQLMKASRQEVSELRDAENMVRFQLRHGNDLLAMDSLRDCDVNVKEQGRLLRQNEFLVWQGKGKKCLRHVFLFEELILFSKARRFPDRKNLDIYIYKNSIKTSDIGLTARIGDSTTKFEIWFRKRKPNDTFTLQSMSEDVKQAWTDELSNLLWKQALRNREMRLAEMSSMGIGNKPCLDIRPSADQISDRSISIAQLSKTAPRFRNSIAVMPSEQVRKRPHSIISVSSSSGASSSSSGEHRLYSQCSSAESGIVSDWVTSPSLSSDSMTPSWSENQ